LWSSLLGKGFVTKVVPLCKFFDYILQLLLILEQALTSSVLITHTLILWYSLCTSLASWLTTVRFIHKTQSCNVDTGWVCVISLGLYLNSFQTAKTQSYDGCSFYVHSKFQPIPWSSLPCRHDKKIELVLYKQLVITLKSFITFAAVLVLRITFNHLIRICVHIS